MAQGTAPHRFKSVERQLRYGPQLDCSIARHAHAAMATTLSPGVQCRGFGSAWMSEPQGWGITWSHGLVVESVNVSVFPYAPVRSASVESMS